MTVSGYLNSVSPFSCDWAHIKKTTPTCLNIELLHNCVAQLLLTWNEWNPKMCFPPQNDDRGCVTGQLAPLHSLFLIIPLVGGSLILQGSLKGCFFLPGTVRGLFLAWSEARHNKQPERRIIAPVSAWPLPVNEPTPQVYQRPQPQEDILFFDILHGPRGRKGDMPDIN